MAQQLNRRSALRMLGALGSLGVLSACSQGGTAPAPAPPSGSTAAGATAVPAQANTTAPAAGGKVFEIQHWHTLTASDGEVWGTTIDNFNAANKDQGLHITAQVIPSDVILTEFRRTF